MEMENGCEGVKAYAASADDAHAPAALARIYGLAIRACDDEDASKVHSILNTLKGLRSLQYKEIASSIHRLYDFCLQFVKDERLDKAREIFLELQQSWNVSVASRLNYDKGLVK